MKIWYRVTITFTMLLVIFALLITGFQLAVYGDSHYGFYKNPKCVGLRQLFLPGHGQSEYED